MTTRPSKEESIASSSSSSSQQHQIVSIARTTNSQTLKKLMSKICYSCPYSRCEIATKTQTKLLTPSTTKMRVIATAPHQGEAVVRPSSVLPKTMPSTTTTWQQMFCKSLSTSPLSPLSLPYSLSSLSITETKVPKFQSSKAASFVLSLRI